MGIDLLTISGKTCTGRRAAARVGASRRARHPQCWWSQEGGYRSGTENVRAWSRFGVAAELMRVEGAHPGGRRCALRDRLLSGLLEAIPDCRLTGSRARGCLTT